MNLFGATLDLASFAKGTEDYTVSSVSGQKLICNELSGRISEFSGGTIWVRSGESAGYFGKIKSTIAQTIELSEAIDIAAGDEITIGYWKEFDTQALINAINSVLATYKVLLFTSDYEYDHEYSGIDISELSPDIRKVVWWDERNRCTKTCHYWKVREYNWLDILDRRIPANAQLGIYYVKEHGPVSKNNPEIHPQVDPLYLRYMSWLYLCRHLIQQTHKDNLVSSDMYNEAKIYERDHSRLPNKALGMRDFTFPQW